MKLDRKALHQLLLRNLQSKGLEGATIPRMMKDLLLSFEGNPSIQRSEMNQRVKVLGWDDIEIDYRTWELAKEAYERNQGSRRQGENEVTASARPSPAE